MSYNEILKLQGKTITVLYTKMYETVAKMVISYYDNEQFNNTLFVVNVLCGENSNDIEYRNVYPGYNKYIYYQLNDIKLNPDYVIPEYMNQFDEIWDYIQTNLPCYTDDVINKVVFMPLRYVGIPKIEPTGEYKYDLCFIGILTPNRQDMIHRITKFWDSDYCKMKIIMGYPYSELYDEIKECKYIINIPRKIDISDTLNGNLILNAICSGKQVIAPLLTDDKNPFTYLIKGYYQIYDVLKLIKQDPIDCSETFKEWTTDNWRYEDYRKYLLGDKYKQRLTL